MIWIPLAFRRGRHRRRWTVRRTGHRGTRCACGGRGRPNGLIDEFQLAQLNSDVVLGYAKEAPDADHDEINFSRLVEQNFADSAELLVLIIVHVEADEFDARHVSPSAFGAVDWAIGAGEAGGGLVCASAGTSIAEASRPPSMSVRIWGHLR